MRGLTVNDLPTVERFLGKLNETFQPYNPDLGSDQVTQPLVLTAADVHWVGSVSEDGTTDAEDFGLMVAFDKSLGEYVLAVHEDVS